ncbi:MULTISPECIES: ABC transporter permease [unclassified Beijerinckia]|uniref:ABC transporter permease n=1 Tax=unclassified Beijerinckia TaxID=2638183 RepID=UPI00089C11D1|nr:MULTISPECIES: ABC transporter permease [unclassified Beijerinckia]MDH7795469.1 sulfonate transport system permease protein [Beijerinckia sp. GAS462]SEC02853.1 sulfonate transport system permease protein [Beijerinckia sp. 28-YEA-48]
MTLNLQTSTVRPRRIEVPRPLPVGLRQIARPFAALLLPAAILAIWQTVAASGWMPPQILPAPSVVGATLIDLIRTGDIATNLAISARRLLWGFAFGAAIGLALGILLGVSERARAYLEPTTRALFAIPTLGWLPIMILIFGIEEPLKILLISKAVLVPIVVNTSQGIRNISAEYTEVARVLRLRPATRFWKLTLPAALPTIFSGVRLGLSHAFIALVVVEMLAATEGIGYMMVWGRTLFQTDIVLAGMIVVGVIGFALDTGLRAIERRLSTGKTADD